MGITRPSGTLPTEHARVLLPHTAVGTAGKASSMPSWFSKPTEERPQTPRVEEPSRQQEVLEKASSRILLLQRLLRGRAAQNVMHEGKETRKALIRELRAAEEPFEDPEEAAADIIETRATEVKLAGTDHTAGATVSKLLLGLGMGYTTPPRTQYNLQPQRNTKTSILHYTASHHLSAADEVKDQELPLDP